MFQTEHLQEKWSPVLAHPDLPKIEDTYKRAVTTLILENQEKALREDRAFLSEAAPTNSTGTAIDNWDPILISLVRRSMPNLIAYDICGVQPMTGPVGQIHTLRVRYAETTTGGATNIAAGDEALSPFKIASSYSGNDSSPAKGAATATLEGTAGKKLNVQILKQVVEAKSRKLSARWTFEAAQDAQAQQGIDIEAEIMAALAQEITAEIDQEILTSLRSLAGSAAAAFGLLFQVQQHS